MVRPNSRVTRFRRHGRHIERIAASFAASTAAFAQASWEEAQRAFDDYQDARAADILRRSAEQGDQRAQKVYGMMLRFGPALFPSAKLRADPIEAQKWLARAAAIEMTIVSTGQSRGR